MADETSSPQQQMIRVLGAVVVQIELLSVLQHLLSH